MYDSPIGVCRANGCGRVATTDALGGWPLCERCENESRRISWQWGQCAKHGRRACRRCPWITHQQAEVLEAIKRECVEGPVFDAVEEKGIWG